MWWFALAGECKATCCVWEVGQQCKEELCIPAPCVWLRCCYNRGRPAVCLHRSHRPAAWHAAGYHTNSLGCAEARSWCQQACSLPWSNTLPNWCQVNLFSVCMLCLKSVSDCVLFTHELLSKRLYGQVSFVRMALFCVILGCVFG